MHIDVAISSVNRKFILSKSEGQLKIGRHSLFFLIYFAQRKYRDGHESTKIPTPKNRKKSNGIDQELSFEEKYSEKLTFSCSSLQWVRLCLKGPETVIAVTSFNKIIRDFFYQDFFNYMNLRLLAKELLLLNSDEIKQYAIDYMLKLNLSDDEINLETLLRNYRRYRLSPNLDVYELIKNLNDR